MNTPAAIIPKPPGRPPVVIDLDRLRELASLGLYAGQIADRLGISRRTLFNQMNADPAVRMAHDEGLSGAVEVMAQNLKRLADEGNLGAIVFFLKTRGGWRQNDAPAVTVNIGTDLGSQPASITVDHVVGMEARHKQMLAEFKERQRDA